MSLASDVFEYSGSVYGYIAIYASRSRTVRPHWQADHVTKVLLVDCLRSKEMESY
jgi:hypothetical protein